MSKDRRSKRSKAMDQILQYEKDIDAFDGVVAVNVSGGASSSVAWHRCLQWWGHSRVVPVFADTRSESPETYQFLEQCEVVFGQTLTVLWRDKTTWEFCEGTLRSDKSNAADIWDCFHHFGVTKIPMANNACKASVEIKQKSLDHHYSSNTFDAIAVGMHIDEIDRAYRLDSAKSAKCFDVKGGGIVLYPCIYPPSMSRCSSIEYLRNMGIQLPPAYEEGFEHNNCQKYGCILSGNAQWVGLLETHPESFARAEEESEIFREKTGFALCRDTRKGESRKFSLKQLREEYERGERFENDWQSTCGCMQSNIFRIAEERENEQE